jgi:hypothetical protein
MPLARVLFEEVSDPREKQNCRQMEGLVGCRRTAYMMEAA